MRRIRVRLQSADMPAVAAVLPGFTGTALEHECIEFLVGTPQEAALIVALVSPLIPDTVYSCYIDEVRDYNGV